MKEHHTKTENLPQLSDGEGDSPESRTTGFDRAKPAKQLSIYDHVREAIISAGSILVRMFSPLSRKWASLWWSMTLSSQFRKVGPKVYCYGPIRILGTRNVSLGGFGNLYDNVLFETIGDGRIIVGDNFRINRGCLLSAHDCITIGDGCLIGEYVSIRDNNHVFSDLSKPIGEQGFSTNPISIGDDVWIGRGAVILHGVTIGKGAVIAANSVVTHDVPGMEIWAGIPARFLKGR